MAGRPQPQGESLAEPGPAWFFEHYDDAAREIVEFFDGDGISLEGRRIADIGCGDGVIDLGIVQRARPAELVGFDIVPIDAAMLLERATRFGVAGALPPELSFRTSEPTRLPAQDAEFDIAVTWSAFEHIADPAAVLAETRRILRPEGVLFLQLWPFFHSSRGSHLWEWCPEPYHHLTESDAEIEARVRGSARNPEFAEFMLREYAVLNRLTVDDLGEALLRSGFAVRKLELLAESAHLPPAALRHRLSALGVSGVKLLATPLLAEERELLGLRRRGPRRRLDRLRRRARGAFRGA